MAQHVVRFVDAQLIEDQGSEQSLEPGWWAQLLVEVAALGLADREVDHQGRGYTAEARFPRQRARPYLHFTPRSTRPGPCESSPPAGQPGDATYVVPFGAANAAAVITPHGAGTTLAPLAPLITWITAISPQTTVGGRLSLVPLVDANHRDTLAVAVPHPGEHSAAATTSPAALAARARQESEASTPARPQRYRREAHNAALTPGAGAGVGSQNGALLLERSCQRVTIDHLPGAPASEAEIFEAIDEAIAAHTHRPHRPPTL